MIAGSFFPRGIQASRSIPEGWGRTYTPYTWSTRQNPTRGDIADILITRRPSYTRYHPSTNPQNPDKYVPGRTLDAHEEGHARVAESFYSKDVVNQALEQVDLTGDVPTNASRTEQKRAANEVVDFLSDYHEYIDNRLMHEEARAAGEPAYSDPILPGYRDADGVYHGVTQSQADDVMRAVQDQARRQP